MVIYSYPKNRPKDADNGDFYISTSETQSTKILSRSYFDSLYIAKSGKLKIYVRDEDSWKIIDEEKLDINLSFIGENGLFRKIEDVKHELKFKSLDDLI